MATRRTSPRVSVAPVRFQDEVFESDYETDEDAYADSLYGDVDCDETVDGEDECADYATDPEDVIEEYDGDDDDTIRFRKRSITHVVLSQSPSPKRVKRE